MDDFEYERRFFCREMPPQLDDGDAPMLIVQSYYVHSDNYALRVRLKTRRTRIPMDRSTDPLDVLDRCLAVREFLVEHAPVWLDER